MGFWFPHEQGAKVSNSKDAVKTADLLLVEASYPSTGSGIEIGWAEEAGIPILCVHRDGTELSQSLNLLAKTVISYKNAEELVQKLGKYLNQAPRGETNPT